MDETACGACGRQMSLKDLEKRSFKEVDGRLLCPECLLKVGQPKKMRCPNCGTQTTALLRKGKYTCSHCGSDIGGQQEDGVIDSARPAGSRTSESEPVRRRTKRTPRPRANRRVRVLAVMVSFFITSSLILAALLIKAHVALNSARRAVVARPEASAQPGPKTGDHALVEALERWAEANPDRVRGALDRYRAVDKKVTDPDLKIRIALAEKRLQVRLDEIQRGEQQAGQIKALQVKLQLALKESDRLKAQLGKTPVAGSEDVAPPTVKKGPAPDTSAEPPPEPKPADTAAEKLLREAKAAYQKAVEESAKLLHNKKYGAAIATLARVAERYGETSWGKEAENERRRIRNEAYDAYQKLSSGAKVLVEVRKDYAGARALYRKALLFGVPDIDGLVKRELAKLPKPAGQDPVTGQVTPAAPEAILSPAVQKLVDGLQDKAERVRRESAQKLGLQGSRGAVPYLIGALKDEQASVRWSAAISLGQLGDTRAVPALIAAFGDREVTVAYDVNEALRKLTKQKFGWDEKAKWLAWYEKNKGRFVSPDPVKAVEAPSGSFKTTVLRRDYSANRLTIVVPRGAGLSEGATLDLLKDGTRVCQVVIDQAGQDEAGGRIAELKADQKIGPGDEITVRLQP